MPPEKINIIGKDYLTEPEAAHYCGVSLSQWKKHNKSLNLSSFVFLGKKQYRKADLIRVMENAWQQSHGEASTATTPSLIGVKAGNNTGSALEKSRRKMRKPSGWKKNCNYARATAAGQ